MEFDEIEWPILVLLCLVRLKSLLHGLEVLKLVGILAQAPSHDSSKLLLGDNILELARNHSGSVPGPEDVGVFVEVVLATTLLVGLAVLLGLAPGVGNRETFTCAVVRQAASLAEVITGATRDVLVIRGRALSSWTHQLP